MPCRLNLRVTLRSLALLLVLSALLHLGTQSVAGQAAESGDRRVSKKLVTGFQQMWDMNPSEIKQWHRLRLEYVVYYYDPLWQAMWGRSGDADSYLSLGSKPFPIKPGQRILVEGLILPERGMIVDDPKVKVLAEAVRVEVLSTQGDIANTARFNKRLVLVEGFVDRQTARDANHQEIELIVEGHSVTAQLLQKNAEQVPVYVGSRIRAKGVYFARSDQNWTSPKLEVWVPGSEDIEVLGPIDSDPRFRLPVSTIAQLETLAPGTPVHLLAFVQEQQPGKLMRIRDNTGLLSFLTAQTKPVGVGEEVEAVGVIYEGNGRRILQQSLYRKKQPVITSMNELIQIPELERNQVHHVSLEVTVFFYDPVWKTAWGSYGGAENYFSFARNPPGDIKPGQRLRIEGQVVPSKGMLIENAKVSLLDASVPLTLLAVEGPIDDVERYNKRPVIVEGFIDRQARTDTHHLEFNLLVGDRAVQVWVPVEPQAVFASLEGSRVRARGVYSATNDPAGGLQKIELWVQSLRDVEVTGRLSSDRRFDAALTPIEKLGSAPSDRLVRITGAVREQQAGRLLAVRDETGQVIVETPQTAAVQLGEQVEAIGYPVIRGAEARLRQGLFRKVERIAAPALETKTTLRLTEQVRELSPEEARRGRPVSLDGMVVWTDASADFFFMHDASGGACVFRPTDMDTLVLLGSKVHVDGVSVQGKFVPAVMASSVYVTAKLDFPAAKQVTLEQALTGVEEAQWVMMSGFAREISREGPYARVALTSSAGELSALVPWSDDIVKLRRCVLRIRGVCSALTNEKRQLTGIQLWVPSMQFIEVEEAEPSDPFSVAEHGISSLRQFSSLQAGNRRVRVVGTVVHHDPGHLLHIQDGTEGLEILSRDAAPLSPGDRVEVVGFLGREGARVILREGQVRLLKHEAEPPPLVMESFHPVKLECDVQLVRIKALLLDLGAEGTGSRLTLQAGTVFDARLGEQKSLVSRAIVPGCQLVLTGVYLVQYDEYKRPHAAQLQLRSMNDIQVLSRPSWWTVNRALGAAGLLAAILVFGVAWMVSLRRQVLKQTNLVRAQVESEKAARLEAAIARASKLESLGVLAGGIAHDFNNLLTVIMGNLSILRQDENIGAEGRHNLQESLSAARRARDLTQQLITFSKGGEPVRTLTNMEEVLRESVAFALHGSNVRSDFDLQEGLWKANVDKGQIGQVVQNIVINARLAMPSGGVVRAALRNEEIGPGERPPLDAGRYLRLSISDTGAGISPDVLPRIFEPFFTTRSQGSGLGLATVHSIVKKHRGHIEVNSKLGSGSTFTLWLPASEGLADGPSSAARPPDDTKRRILLMDDDTTIRNMISAYLKRQGFDVTAVADGADAVREFERLKENGHSFDLAIMDLTVPGGMGGREAMERIHALAPALKAIVSSGYSDDSVMTDFRSFGFHARVVKPYVMEDLMSAINEVLGNRMLPS